MKLHKTSAIIIGLTSLGLVGLLVLAGFVILRASFSNLERGIVAENVERARQGLLNVINRIDSLALDWASWDDSYAFINDRNLHFIESNLNDQTLINQRLNVVIFFDAKGQIAYSKYFDPMSGELSALPPGYGEALGADALYASGAAPAAFKGLVVLPEGILLLSGRPILTSENKGPTRGLLLIGRFLVKDVTAEIAVATRLSVTFPLFDDDALESELKSQLLVNPQKIAMFNLSQVKIASAAALLDIFGNPALVVRVELERVIHAEQLKTMLYHTSSLLVAVLVCGFVSLALIERVVLTRIRSVAAQVEGIGVHGDANRRVDIQGADELVDMARNINGMLAELDKAKSSLTRQVQELRDNQRYLHTLVDSIQAGVLLVDAQTYAVVEINAFALRMAGRNREDVLGMDCHGLLCPAEKDKCLAMDAGGVEHSPRVLLTAQGEELPILKSVTTVERNGRGCYLETFIDISGIVKAEKALRLSEETYRTIFTNTGAATVIVDADDTLRLINPEFEKFVAMGKLELENRKKWTDFIHPEDAPLFTSAAPEASSSAQFRTGRLQCRMTPPHGVVRHVSLSVASIPETTKRVVSIQDVTELKEAEWALRNAQILLEGKVEARTRALQEANVTLKAMDQMKDAFLSSASHELRTPLTSVLGFAKLMDKTFTRAFLPLAAGDERLERKAREFSSNFKIIQEEGERLTRLINDLLDLNKIESGRIQWRDEAIDMVALLQNGINAMRGEFAMKPGVEALADIPAELPRVWAEKDRIHQVLFNLLNNAAKFTTKGYVRLVGRAVEGDELEIRVEDTGIGLPREELSKVFDKFYQAQGGDELRDKPVGTGLGLAICAQIVTHYEGRIWAESTVGVGSAFVLRLPTMPPEEQTGR